MELLKRGKVKDIYELDEGRLLFRFTDRVSAFDVVLPNLVPRKGEVLCRFAAFWFGTLPMPNHMLSISPPTNDMTVRKLHMVPVECVVRGYLYGSLYERVKKGSVKLDSPAILAAELPEPIFDPTTKYEAHDRPITPEEIVKRGWLKEDELEFLREKSIELYQHMVGIAGRANFIMADVKFEFGRDEAGRLVLADSLGPDEFRLWPAERYLPGAVQESFDKQLIRDWLIEQGYKGALDRAAEQGEEPPKPPLLPLDLVERVSRRYIEAYRRITGKEGP